MKILHTSDWHLGRSLYSRKRYEEFSAFLDWLIMLLDQEGIDALLIAGDVFDSSTPSNRAQELYYRFLSRVSTSGCKHVVVIAGNHDSPSFLAAPKALLRALNVHVVGARTSKPEDEVIVLRNNSEKLQNSSDDIAIVCAVPYLRDKDIRTVEPGETIDDKNRKLIKGVKSHYAEVVALAVQQRDTLRQSAQSSARRIPIIAMGHLFTAGGKTVDGDGVRELYVGSLAHVGKDVFPSSIDYLALGHLHVPQTVGNTENIRYSGSPIPMGFSEAGQDKKVITVDFDTGDPVIHEIQIPCFQHLIRITGALDDIRNRIELLKQSYSQAWLEIEYTGRDIIANLREILEDISVGSDMEILRIKNKRLIDRLIHAFHDDETLDELDSVDVFARCLDSFDVPEQDRAELTTSYNEIIHSLHEEDINAR